MRAATAAAATTATTPATTATTTAITAAATAAAAVAATAEQTEETTRRLQCGIVYAWNCAGELYAIECALCEKRPLCTLTEFSEHMNVWHSDWQAEAETEALVDELMQEVLAEQTSGPDSGDDVDNELKEQLVQQLNAADEEEALQATAPSLSAQIDFGLHNSLPNQQNSKLSTFQVDKLIELYRQQPCLWNQAHTDFRNVELCRESWRQLTDAWSTHCGRQFSVTDVRIRVSTLCQRFLKQRERLEAEGELDDSAKFVHFDQLSFLCEQQSLLKRREHFARENRKLLEVYEHYPILWHNAHKRLRCADTLRQRHEAVRGMQLALRMSGINLAALAVQRRIQSLRKRYRLEKIRYLHSVVEGKQAAFCSTFEHYEAMEFLNKHIDPYVCAVCGQIFEQLLGHQRHVQGNCQGAVTPETAPSFEVTVGEIMAQLEEATTTKEQQQQQAEGQQLEEQRKETLEPKTAAKEAGETAALPAPADTPAVAAAEPDSTEHNLSTGAQGEQTPEAPTGQRLRLSMQQTYKLIELYKSHACLWNPNHLDYHTRQQRQLAWQSITEQLNAQSGSGKQRYSWQLLHRKLTDYTKYFRREKCRQSSSGTRWCFYDALRFLDDVLPISCELQKTLQQRDNNLKIIDAYRSYAQLWCTEHPDYTKRKQRLRHVESLCTRLQEECNLQITVERLKSRLIDFRCQYRQCKVARLAAHKRGESWQPSYEYYEALQFLEAHVSPFVCGNCPVSFKRRTDYVRHARNVHLQALLDADDNLEPQPQPQSQPKLEPGKRRTRTASAKEFENICHVCGMKFSLRTSLLAHLRRHLGQRTHACTECPKKFFNSTSLRVHMRSHTREQPYVCEHCARGFVNASKLNQHVKRHRNQRDYPCNRCDKAFYTAHERDRHIRAHLNIRDKVCPYCSRAFVVGSAYYAHLNLHRGEKRYECNACGRRFAQYAGLYKHRKRCLPAEPMEE